MQETFTLHLPIANSIIPSDVPTYTWDVFTPNFGAKFPVIGDGLMVLGRVTYDYGFGQMDSVGICYVFQVTTNQWELCGGDTSTYIRREQKN
jgi:hypothetical protein